jgi:hypothetical protein
MPYESNTNGHGYRWSSPEPIGGPGARHRATSAPRRPGFPTLTFAVLGGLLLVVSLVAWANGRPSVRRRRPAVVVTKTVYPAARNTPERMPAPSTAAPSASPSPTGTWAPTGAWPWP